MSTRQLSQRLQRMEGPIYGRTAGKIRSKAIITFCLFKIDNMGLRHSRPDMTYSTRIYNGRVDQKGRKLAASWYYWVKIDEASYNSSPTSRNEVWTYICPLQEASSTLSRWKFLLDTKLKDSINSISAKQMRPVVLLLKQNKVITCCRIRVVKIYAEAFQRADRWKGSWKW